MPFERIRKPVLLALLFHYRSLLLELGKGSQIVVTIPYLLLKESDNVTAFRIRGKDVNVWLCIPV